MRPAHTSYDTFAVVQEWLQVNLGQCDKSSLLDGKVAIMRRATFQCVSHNVEYCHLLFSPSLGCLLIQGHLPEEFRWLDFHLLSAAQPSENIEIVTILQIGRE